MLALFEPVVRQICELIHKQIAAVRKQMNVTVNVSKTEWEKKYHAEDRADYAYIENHPCRGILLVALSI